MISRSLARQVSASATPSPLPETLGSRQRLLEAGVVLFLSQGFEATALEQVRKVAGVSNGSLYHHFPTKAHLARAMYVDALAHYQTDLASVLAARPSAAAGVRAFVLGHIAWLLRHPQSARVLTTLRDATRVEGQPPEWRSLNADAFGRLQAWLDIEMAARRMRRMDLRTWLALVLAPVMQLTEAWLREPRPDVPRATRLLLAEAAVRAVTSEDVTRLAPRNAAPPRKARSA